MSQCTLHERVTYGPHSCPHCIAEQRAEERGYQRGLAERDAEVARLRERIEMIDDDWTANGIRNHLRELLDGSGRVYDALALAATGAKPRGEATASGESKSPSPDRADPVGWNTHPECSHPPEKLATQCTRCGKWIEAVLRAEPIYCECGDILETASQYETHRKIYHPNEDSPRAEPDEAQAASLAFCQKHVREFYETSTSSIKFRHALAALLRSRDEAASAETVRAVCEALQEQDGPGRNAWMRTAVKWLEAGAWKKGGRNEP